MPDSTQIKDSAEKPSLAITKDAVNHCKQAIGMLYCIISANEVDVEDKSAALGFVTNHLEDQVSTLRAYFDMDKKEATS
jgi:hypothetical protein